ncbi:translesion DNA synthesis-associated protein ImuA [Reinekea marina]|uniref:Translesion DNA synthesis-associated protein ImuA n=1 Tax=Reinekea marina TaxID=1310421 RepID=A0ABV7WTZ2_9GAMM|nr:translesion DNA synthesis-associated protein ImuA [Reinekea marina]MDN3648777.1 translesion DNA synthesis-associated protein ImuA [Reinekea marina]
MNLISLLAEQGHIWTHRNRSKTVVQGLNTGYAELNNELPGQGWPVSAVTEVLYPKQGMGELRLLLPALAQLSHADTRWQLWLNAPYLPCGPALQHWQLNTQRLLLANASRAADLCHCVEKSLQSGGCQAAVVWVEKLDKALMRRIQLAAEQSATPVFLLRPEKCLSQPSVAALRIKLNSASSIDIVKRRAGWPLANLAINLPLHLGVH